jgi:CubicO group peptidase (beta-lactamase class C family)
VSRPGAVLSLALIAACAPRAPSGSGGDPRLAPPALGDGLEVATPGQVAMNAADLSSWLASAAADQHRDLRSVLVARKGRLVVEAYFDGADRDTPHDVRSVGKSVTSTLAGIALHEGRIASLDLPLARLVPEMASSPAGKAGVTLRRLLEMRSGLAVDDFDPRPGAFGEEAMDAAPDRLRFAVSVPMAAPPGERFAYASLNTMLLGRAIAAATGRDLADYAREKLFAPLGFGRWQWRRDAQGQVIAQGNLLVRPRDLLKLGLLFQQGGRWHGRQVVPAAWIAEATGSRSTLPEDPTTGLGTLYRGYGYQWWTGSERAGAGAATVPLYFASGNGGQRLFVVPDRELVVVVTSAAYNRIRGHHRAHAILRACLAACR